MEIFVRLADPVGAFAPETLRRARVYAGDGAVFQPELTRLSPTEVTARAGVRGTGGMVYTTVLEAGLAGRRLELETRCSCPVVAQCKHGAALALVLGRMFAGEAAGPPVDAVEQLLGELADLAPPEPGPGVGLLVRLVQPRGFGRHGGPTLTLRPVRPGKRQPWVRTGLGWPDVPAALARSTYDARQLRALERLRRTAFPDHWYAGELATLDDLGPGGPALLADALEAGVTVVPDGGFTDLAVSREPLHLELDARAGADAGERSVRVGLRHAGRLWHGSAVSTLGQPAATALLLDEGHLVVAPIDPPLPPGPVQALRRAEPVVVSDDAALRRLATLAPLGSEDGSVALPEPVAPLLRATVTWRAAGVVDVRWEWVYDGFAAFALDTSPGRDVARQRAAEAEILGRLDPPPRAESTLTGADALHLALLELPVWRETEGVRVVEVDPPDFREADEGPQIRFDVAEPEPGAEAGHTDWLDLEVHVTVQGERVPLADVLAALTLGESHLVLPSGLYVATDAPEFAALDDLVRAAEQLLERRAERVRVGRGDLGLWAQVADLGPVDAQAQEWVARARALRDLTDVEAPEPVGVVSTLRPYQRDGLAWLALLWRHGLGGVLADDMGLGKTLQVLALIAHARAERPESAPFLVVAPTSVVSAWVEQAARHTPGLRVVAVTASQARRDAALVDLAAGADLVVTTYTLLRLEADDYAGLEWGGLVLDEAQQVKNHRSKAWAAVRRLRAPFRLAVTGTPFENRLMELWSLLAIAAPGLYPQAQQFVRLVATPVEKERDEGALRRFSQRIRPFVLRRTKELVAADLPPKQEQELAVELSPRHRRLYDTHLARERQRVLGLLVEDFDANRVAILASLTRLRQLALDPALVDPAHEGVGSAKIDELVERLAEVREEGHRALVFSQFTGFLGRVRERLTAEGVETAYLDGRTRDRAAVIEGFRSGTAPVFLISLKAGGVGLTLTEADYVFVLDPWWNPAAEAQAVDRAHRIGQERTVMVYRLVSRDTIEDKVMALKARKAALFAQVVDGGAGLDTAITADDVRGLFE